MSRCLLTLLLLICSTSIFAGKPPRKDPEHNFEVFWSLFNRHYAHFEHRGVDWAQQYQRFRPQVGPSTTDAELLALFKQMVAPLKDLAHHITIQHTHYVRLHLSERVWKGETILIVVRADGQVIEHCGLPIDYLSSRF